MSRLTKRKKDGKTIIDMDVGKDLTYPQHMGLIQEKLAHYEDLEEAGRLIELPCKVGDTVYRLHYAEGRPYAVIAIKIKELALVVSMMEAGYFGKRVFLTKAEAEARLAELKGGAE